MNSAELTAALLALAFTGLIPSSQDHQGRLGRGRNGAVDILLTDLITGEHQVMEVTTSLDRDYQRSSAALDRFEMAVSGAYSGQRSWALDLDRGWHTLRLVNGLAPIVAEALNEIAANGDDSNGPFSLNSHVIAWPANEATTPQIKVVSRNAGALNREDPYLNALSDYLATDGTIKTKLEKLGRESSHFKATRSHLFIGMASTGPRGGLLPSSPSYFTDGDFDPPEELTDLWLEGNTGELFHWTKEEGWVFHDLRS